MSKGGHVNLWKEAVIDAAINHWVITEENSENPTALIRAMIQQVIREHLDPVVSEQAAMLSNRMNWRVVIKYQTIDYVHREVDVMELPVVLPTHGDLISFRDELQKGDEEKQRVVKRVWFDYISHTVYIVCGTDG